MPQQRSIHPTSRFDLEEPDLIFGQFTTLEAITEADSLYLNSSGYIGRARANSSTTMHAIGVAAEGIASGLIGRVKTHGRHSSTNYNFSGFIGRLGYVSTGSAGGVQTTPPAASGQLSQVIGHMIDASTLYVAIQGAFQVGQSL